MTSSPRNISDQIYAKIGKGITTWSLIEHVMEQIILDVQEIPETHGLPISSSIGFRSKMDLLRLMLTSQQIDRVKETEAWKLLVLIDSAYIERNSLAHDAWFPTDAHDTIRRMSVRVSSKALTLRNDLVTGDDLDELNENFFTLFLRLVEMHEDGTFRQDRTND